MRVYGLPDPQETKIIFRRGQARVLTLVLDQAADQNGRDLAVGGATVAAGFLTHLPDHRVERIFPGLNPATRKSPVGFAPRRCVPRD